MPKVDLFGDVPDVQQKVKVRTAGRSAYPAAPGTGPEGKKCRHCKFCIWVHGGVRAYPKCEKNKPRWTHGTGSDINTRMPSCKLFEPIETTEPKS